MAKGKSGKSKKGWPGNHAHAGKKIKKRSAAVNASMFNAPVPVPVPIPAHVPVAHSMMARNETGIGEGIPGFIFMCSGSTKPECYRYRVFGLPEGRMETVLKIRAGMKLFLFDVELKLLYGVYQATSNGGNSLEPAAFGGQFPAQVRFSILEDCLPLPESVFKRAIPENYRAKRKFMPELSSQQVDKLLSLFQPIPVQRMVPLPPVVDNLHLAPAHLPQPQVPYRGAAMPIVDNQYPAPFLPQDPYTVPPAVDDWHLPVARLLPPRDPYRGAAYAARGPPVMEPPLHALPAGRPSSSQYGTAAHPARVQPVAESRSALPVGLPPAHEPYYPPDPRQAYLPQHPAAPESTYKGHPTYGGREAETIPVSDSIIDYFSIQQSALPGPDPAADYYSNQRPAPPRPDPVVDYYSTQHATSLRSDPTFDPRTQSTAPPSLLIHYYGSRHVTPSLATELPAQMSHRVPGYQDPNQMHGDISVSNGPASSLYASARAYR